MRMTGQFSRISYAGIVVLILVLVACTLFTIQPCRAVGTAFAWGDDNNGELDNFFDDGWSEVPVQVDTLPGNQLGSISFAAITGGDNYAIALDPDGTVSSWGLDYYGECGDGEYGGNDFSLHEVVGLTKVMAIAAEGAGDHSLALLSDGTVWAWGLNSYGQLGVSQEGEQTQNGYSISDVPVQVPGLTGVTAIAVGGDHSLALKSDGTVWTWGSDASGQLGNGTMNAGTDVPTQVVGLTGVTTIAAGDADSLALKSDGTVWAWGDNSSGQLGDGLSGAASDSDVPVQVIGLPGAAMAIAGGYSHDLALFSDGAVWAWGDNSSGELGDGTTYSNGTPVQVTGLTGATAIAAGDGFSLALLSNGAVQAWGFNGTGQLGDESLSSSIVPVPVANLNSVIAIAAGIDTSYAIVAPPPAPTGLTATPGYAQVVLAWTISSAATSYDVYRSTASGGANTVPIATGVITGTYTDTGLSGTTYYYAIAAVGAGGTSAPSAEVSATPKPPAPTGLTAIAGNAQIALLWTASPGATSYNIYRVTTSTGEVATPTKMGIPTNSYTDTGLTNGVTYYYRVAAVGSGGTSGKSSQVGATPMAPPPAPTGLSATAGNGQVAISWTASVGATAYNVYRSTASGGEGTTLYQAAVATMSYTDTGLMNGTTYYKVAAVNAGGTSPQSTEASATPEPPAPAPITGLTATAGDAQISLIWIASQGATSYNIFRGTSAGEESDTPVATGVVTTKYTDTGLTNGRIYYYKAAAVNGGGTSALSSEVGAAPQAQSAGLYADLHDFGGLVINADGSNGPDGFQPYGSVTLDSAGDMYGTASVGGANGESKGGSGDGMVWKITASGAYDDLHDFGGTVTNADGITGPDGTGPLCAVTFDGEGNMYGTTFSGGAYGDGMAWEINTTGTYKDLHDFGGAVTNADGSSGPDGMNPAAGVTLDSDGNLYGTTENGGPVNGIVWEITSSGVYRDLHDFGVDDGTDGIEPVAAVTVSGGNLYGTTTNGGANLYYGMVWEITSTGTYKDLHDFAGSAGTSGADGSEPESSVTLDAFGNVYGSTSQGGTIGAGTVWEITAAATYRILHDFGGTVIDADGVSGPDGNTANAAVVVNSAGAIFGTATLGGPGSVSNDGGMLWEITPAGTYRDLHDFGATVINASGTSGPDGQDPIGITFDSTGNAYGAASFGGPNGTNFGGDGMVFKLAEGSAWTWPPAVPTVKAAPGDARVELSWTASAGATSYTVYRSTTNGAKDTTPYISLKSTSYLDTGLTNGTAYYYTVSAVDAQGASLPSSPVSAKPLAPPLAPSGVTATGGSAAVTVAWKASATAASYNVYWEAPGWTSYRLASSTTSLVYTQTGLPNGTTYSFEVAAVNVGGTSPSSTSVTGTPIAAPTGVTATDATAEAGVAWKSSTEATSYNVYWEAPGWTSYRLAASTTALSFLQSGLTNGTAYTFEVAAVESGGTSALSPVVTATPIAVPTAVTATGGNALVTLTWKLSAGATKYNVYRGTSAGLESSTPIASGITTTSYTNIGLTNGVKYYYKITAVNSGGSSTQSAEVSATPAS